MASAVASSMPSPPPAVSFGWLGPPALLTSSLSKAAAAVDPAVSKEFIDFEFSLGGSATMLPADELFADGKLLPLRPHPVVTARETGRERVSSLSAETSPLPPTPEQVKTARPTVGAAATEVFDAYVFSPKAPTCSSRWRELLRLKKVQTPPQKPSPSLAATANVGATPSGSSISAAARSLKLLLNSGGRASSDLAVAPLLRDSSDSEASLSLASSRFSLSSSSSSGHDHDDFPRHSLDSPRPRIRLVRSSQPHTHPPAIAAKPRAVTQSPARRRPSPSPAPLPPPQVVSVDSPRMNSSGKIVFQGLERSSSSPAGPVRTRSRVMDRSYSAGVRATPVVLNVPVCSRPVFGFFKDRKETPAKDSSAGRPRSALGRKLTYAGANANASNGGGGASTVSCRDLGSSK